MNPSRYNGCNHLSMQGLKLNHISNRVPDGLATSDGTTFHTDRQIDRRGINDPDRHYSDVT